ncbi:cytochrome P450 [Streptomyces sp. NPDC002044]|uniref:cytochrome P450 n=1 Tax=Streptomyces sp. NPDC002044 TaxID=3154662 RepID=UPI003327B2A7
MRTVQEAALGGLGALVRGLVGSRPRRTDTVHTSAATLHALRARHGYAPLLLRTRGGRAVLVLLDPRDLGRFYAEPASVLAAEPPEKCRSPYAAEPAGAGCGHGAPRPEPRRTDTQALAPGLPVHPSYEPILTLLAEEARQLTASGTLELARVRHTVDRVARRIVLGHAAAQDERLTGWLRQLRAEGGRPGPATEPGTSTGRSRATARSLYGKADERIREYARRADGDTLLGRAARHPGAPGRAHQWLAALDTLPETLLRTLLLLGAHPAEQRRAATEAGAAAAPGELPWLRACVRESLRLYPVVPDLIRVTRTETDWHGVRHPAGTVVLLPAAFHQRDPEHVPAAHAFVPGRWKDQGAVQDIRMAPFGHGAGRCPGDQLGLLVTAALCAEVLRSHRIEATRPVLDPVGPLPETLGPHGIRLTLARR